MSNNITTSIQSATRAKADYQQFKFDENGFIYDVQGRMLQKLKAFHFLPKSFKDKSALDIGCDFGFWCFLAALKGAKEVLGVDRNRYVKGLGKTNLIQLNKQITKQWPQLYGKCNFEHYNIGLDFPQLGEFDYVFMCSVYHHIFANCGSHTFIADWLASVTKEFVIWEGPLGVDDPVAFNSIPKHLHPEYTEEKIFEAFVSKFNLIETGPALHEPTRTVLYLRKNICTSV